MTPLALLQHDDSGQPWPPGDGDFGDLAEAYQASLAVRALRQARGERPRGYKVGFTNRTIWPRYNVFAPIWGTVWDTTLSFTEGAQPGTLALSRTCQPRIEPEAVFGFRAAPARGAGLQELFEALDWIAPGFEIVQSHLPGWKFVAAQTVADNGLHARLHVGARVAVTDVAHDADGLHRRLAATQVSLRCGEETVEAGSGAHVLDSPLHALLHFLNELRACPGAADIAPGDVVTTGTWTDAWPVAPGQTWSSLHDDVLPPLRLRLA